MVAAAGQYWLGAKENVLAGVGGWGTYYWTGDNSTVDNGNWANGYPLSGLVNITTYQYIFYVTFYIM